MSDLKVGAKRLTDWLYQDALPIWWEKGADHQRGGYQELLALDGSPVASDRRARVQTRQIYCYAAAGRLGWDGPWKDAVNHGLIYFLDHYRRADSVFRTKVHADGTAADESVWLYDQAFALLATAEATRVLPDRTDLKAIAKAVVSGLSDRKLAAGGYTEADQAHPYQSNPHMHLLEACLAWAEIDPDPMWNAMVDEIIGLSLHKYIDANGALHEFFAEDWTLERGEAGRIVEPGHQFEWAWLLERWSRLRSRDDAHRAALRLYEIGVTKGVDRRRGVAFDQLLDDFSIYKGGARLWPQTERIKASAILSRSADAAQRPAFEAECSAAIVGLERYLDVPVKGLWRDKLSVEDVFADEPAPASSFYHIVCAIQELQPFLG